MTKKFWWGVLVGVFGTVVMADQSEFGSGAREFFSQARNTISAFFSTASMGSKNLGEGVAE